MVIDQRVEDLFYELFSYSRSIYENIKVLCELEKAGKKSSAAYYNHFLALKRLLKEENEIYIKCSDFLLEKKGEILSYIDQQSNSTDKNNFDVLSHFHESIIYERIKSKVKYYVGLKKNFNGSLLSNITGDQFRNIGGVYVAFLEDTLLSDIQKVSMYYMSADNQDDAKSIDYKYLCALLFNFDIELINTFFEISKDNIYLTSGFIYTLSGIYNDVYYAHSQDILIKKFREFYNYIVTKLKCADKSEEYKVDIAISCLKAILDLLPQNIKNQFFDEFAERQNADSWIPQEIKDYILNELKKADKGRALIKNIIVPYRD